MLIISLESKFSDISFVPEDDLFDIFLRSHGWECNFSLA